MGISAAMAMSMAVGAMAVSNMAPTPGKMPDLPDLLPKDKPAADAASRQRRQPRGGRSGTILTGPTGVENGQQYNGNTLLGG